MNELENWDIRSVEQTGEALINLGSIALVYAREDEIKLMPYPKFTIEDQKFMTTSDGWKHIATIDPLSYLENVANKFKVVKRDLSKFVIEGE